MAPSNEKETIRVALNLKIESTLKDSRIDNRYILSPDRYQEISNKI